MMFAAGGPHADAGSWVDAWKKREVVRKEAEAANGGKATANGPDPSAAQQQKVFAKRFARAQARTYIYCVDFDNDTTSMQVYARRDGTVVCPLPG